MSSTRSERAQSPAKPRAPGSPMPGRGSARARPAAVDGFRVARRPQRVRPRRLKIRWPRTILAAVVVYVLVTLCAQEIALFRVRRQIDQLETQIVVERERSAILDAERAYRDTDEYIELIARRELGMVLPGEVPVINGVRP